MLGACRLGRCLVAGDPGRDVTYDEQSIQSTVSESDAGLIFFLTHLYTRLQKLGTVPAIDLAEDGRPLEAGWIRQSDPR